MQNSFFFLFLCACRLRITPRLSLGAMLVGLALLGPTAQAGYWKVDHYNVVRDATSQSHEYTGYVIGEEGGPVAWVHMDKVTANYPYGAPGSTWLTIPGDQSVSVGASLNYSARRYEDSPNFQMKPGQASCSASVTAVFKWMPSGDNDPPPASLLMLEYGDAQAALGHRDNNNPYNEAQPYQGQHFTIEELSNGLETLQGNAESFGSWHAYYDGTSYGYRFRNLTTVINRSYAKVLSTGGQSVVNGPTRKIGGKVKSPGWQTVQLGQDWYGQVPTAAGSLSASYRVKVATAMLRVRRKGATVVPPGQTEPVPAPFSASTTIAAGQKNSDEHKAEVQVTLWVPGEYYSPLPYGFDVSELPALKAWPVPVGHEAMGAFALQPNSKIDTNGTALLGTWTSSDFTKNLTLYLEGLTGTINATVYQDWADVEWKMGANGEKAWNTRFLLNGGDYSEWVWTKVKTVEDKPLLGHTMKLVVDRLEVSHTDTPTGETRTTLYTTNPAESAQYDPEDSSVEVIYKADLSDQIANFVTLPGALSDSGGGVYKGQLTIKKSADFSVEDVKLALADQGVYVPAN